MRHGHEPAEGAGRHLCARLGASDIATLRELDAQQLADAALNAGFMPGGTIDGHVLPDEIAAVFEQGRQAKVPLLAGFNSGEIRSLPFLMPKLPATPEAHEIEIRARYGDLAASFLTFYQTDHMVESALASLRDALYGWTILKLSQAKQAAGVPFFLYYFDHSYPAANAAGPDGFHASEQAMAQAIGDYWIAFAATGQPQAAGAANWPAHLPQGWFMHFVATPRATQNLLPSGAKLCDEMIARHRAAGDVPWNWNIGVAAPLPKGRSDRQ